MKLTENVENPLFVPSDQESPSHILKALNDDCLHEVFKKLHYVDLLNVVKVCVRFQSQGKAAFASKYKSLELVHNECDHDKMIMVLHEFKSFIQSLSVHADKNADTGHLFGMIIANCSPELKELDLSHFNIQVDTPNFRLPFPKLETLRLFDCSGNISVAHLVDTCPELHSISVSSGDLQGVNGLINRKFNQLKCLYLLDYEDHIHSYALENFITLNPDLTDLKIRKPSQFLTSNAIRLIGQTMLELQELECNLSFVGPAQSDFKCIGNLYSLNMLHLDFNKLEVVPVVSVLAANVLPIEHLSITNGLIDKNAVKYISQLKRIVCLQMHEVDGLNDELVISLARNLPELRCMDLTDVIVDHVNDSLTVVGLMQMLEYANNLRVLKLGFSVIDQDFNFIINIDDYKTMVNTVRYRREKISLSISLFGDNIKLNVDDAVLKENENILTVE